MVLRSYSHGLGVNKYGKIVLANAEVVCEAVGRPNIRFVPIKNIEQQAVLLRASLGNSKEP